MTRTKRFPFWFHSFPIHSCSMAKQMLLLDLMRNPFESINGIFRDHIMWSICYHTAVCASVCVHFQWWIHFDRCYWWNHCSHWVINSKFFKCVIIAIAVHLHWNRTDVVFIDMNHKNLNIKIIIENNKSALRWWSLAFWSFLFLAKIFFRLNNEHS